jgi:hypothetical protein
VTQGTKWTRGVDLDPAVEDLFWDGLVPKAGFDLWGMTSVADRLLHMQTFLVQKPYRPSFPLFVFHPIFEERGAGLKFRTPREC